MEGHTKLQIDDGVLSRRVIDLYNDHRLAHLDYLRKAQRNCDFFVGDGRQWDEEVVAELCKSSIQNVELNKILPTVLSLLGYAINNRMDVVAYPTGENDSGVSDIITKLFRNILKNCSYNQKEVAVILDGLIKKRGYFDVRMSFDKNALGEIDVTTVDPYCVLPDMNSSSPDPDDWRYVIIKRWLSYEEMEIAYGKEKAEIVKNSSSSWSADSLEQPTNFRDNEQYYYNVEVDGKYLVYEMQECVYGEQECVIYPTGEVKLLTENDKADADRMASYVTQGCAIQKRRCKTIRWYQVAADIVLHQSISPYQHFTLVPYFPLFVRGITMSPVDNLIMPQVVMNKMATQMLHHINTVVNSGWLIEQNSLTNMTTDDIELYGSRTKVAIEYAKNSTPPQRIQADNLPNGFNNLLSLMEASIKSISGIDETVNGAPTSDTSGVAVQARQFFSLQNQAIYIENLNHMRERLGKRISALISEYYDSYRVFRVIEPDPKTGVSISKKYEINVPKHNDTGIYYLNDITLTQYDVEVSSQPTQATFQNNQFTQAMEMLKEGLPIPPHIIVKYSTLADKSAIIEALQNPEPDKVKEAVRMLKLAQAEKYQAEAINKRTEGVYSATTAGVLLAQNSDIAPAVDEILLSSGYQDKNSNGSALQGGGSGAQTVSPETVGGNVLPKNNNPLTPPNPMSGMNAGIEAGSQS
jgi:hypothetical protein